MTRVYTNVVQYNGKIFHRYIENGKRYSEHVNFKPMVGFPVEKETGWKDVYGNNIYMETLDNIDKFSKKRKSIQSQEIDIYNDFLPIYQFISRMYPNDIKPQLDNMKIYNIDIEVDSAAGFPKADLAEYPVVSITINDLSKNLFFVLAFKDDYTPPKKNIYFKKCKDEYDLLERFIQFWSNDYPDLITGWNVDGFDIKYLVNRIGMLLTKDAIKNLSPLSKVEKRKTQGLGGKEDYVYQLIGIQIIDYMELYKKITLEPRERYSLDAILGVELGTSKLDHGYNSLSELYEKDFQMFIDYNIRDTEGVCDLDRQLNYLDLFLNIAYMSKVNVEDCFGTTRKWIQFIYNHLMKKQTVIQPLDTSGYRAYPGGYVRDPKEGFYRYMTVWDIESSYPGQIRAFNISPESIIPLRELHPELQTMLNELKQKKPMEELSDYPEQDRIIQACMDVDSLEKYQPLLEKHNVCFTAPGHFYRKNKYGFIPEVVSKVFQARVDAKKALKDAKIMKPTNEKEEEERKNLMAAKHAEQYALKIMINSLYGALANQYFHFFDVRLAESITCMGQVCIRGCAFYVEKKTGIKVRYIDTDSIFLDFEDLLKEKGYDLSDTAKCLEFLKKYNQTEMQTVINEFYDKLCRYLGAYKNIYKMEFEVISDKTIFTGKKRYVMKLIHKDGVDVLDKYAAKVRGLEIVRTSTPQIIRDDLTEMLQYILENENKVKTFDKVRKLKAHFKTLPFEDVAFPRSVSLHRIDKDGNSHRYELGQKSVPIQVTAALVYNKYINDNKLVHYREIVDKDKIKFCYLKVPNLLNSHVVACVDNDLPKEIRDLVEIDYEQQFESAFIRPMKTIFEAIDWKYNEKTTSLEAFFGKRK